jgi:hypothetical protein
MVIGTDFECTKVVPLHHTPLLTLESAIEENIYNLLTKNYSILVGYIYIYIYIYLRIVCQVDELFYIFIYNIEKLI